MRKKSLFITYFISYMGTSLILITIFGVIFYYINIASLDTEIKNSQFAIVSQLSAKIDYLLESMSNIAYHFSSSEVDAGYASIKEEKRAPIIEDLISRRLYNYEQNTQIAAKLMVYFRGDTRVYLSDGSYGYAEFEKNTEGESDFTMSRVFHAINSVKAASVLRIVKGSEPWNIAEPAAAFIYPIPYMSLTPDASIAFFISEMELKELFDNYSGEGERNVYLINDKMQTIYESEAVKLTEPVRYELMRKKGTGVFDITVENRPFIYIRALSAISNYSIIVLVSAADFYNNIDVMKHVISMCITLLALFSLLIAFIMAVRNYKPIRRILSELREEGDGGVTKDADEIETVRMRINETRRRNKELGRIVAMQSTYVVFTCLNNILRGKVDDKQELKFQMQCTNISFPWQYYQVLLVIPLGGGQTAEKNQYVFSICEDIVLSEGAVYCVEIIFEKYSAVIVNSNTQQTGMQVSEIIKNNMLNIYGIDTTIGLGRVYQIIEDVHSSFLEAVAVLNEYISPGSIMCFSDITDNSSETFGVSDTDQVMLVQSLRQGDKAVALRSLDNIMEKIKQSGGSFLNTKYMCFDVSNSLLKVASQVGMNIRHSDLKGLDNLDDLDKYKAEAYAMAEIICEQSEMLKEKKKSDLSVNVISYVNKNFNDSNLSLERTAEHFELSTSYLSRFFKQATGFTFVNYITTLRMNVIKDKLANTDLQIKDIVTATGYIDVASFVRKFKSLEGITPSQYREQRKTH